jgi:phosphoserine phosphatase
MRTKIVSDDSLVDEAINPVPMAICYDFDGTLAPGNMQERDFLPGFGIEPANFWAMTRRLAEEQDSDEILAYMRLMLDTARHAGISVRREDFRRFGSRLECSPGVEAWFDRINSYALRKGAALRHFVISSGLREMIEGSSIAGRFFRIYASGFMYDAEGTAVWPALAVNYTTKTQFLFRINKGTLEVYDNSTINKSMPKEERAVPFERIVYIGDGETDIPCFRLVKQEGGHSIAVYPKGDADAKARIEGLVAGRVTALTPADYTEGSPLDLAVKSIIDAAASSPEA